MVDHRSGNNEVFVAIILGEEHNGTLLLPSSGSVVCVSAFSSYGSFYGGSSTLDGAEIAKFAEDLVKSQRNWPRKIQSLNPGLVTIYTQDKEDGNDRRETFVFYCGLDWNEIHPEGGEKDGATTLVEFLEKSSLRSYSPEKLLLRAEEVQLDDTLDRLVSHFGKDLCRQLKQRAKKSLTAFPTPINHNLTVMDREEYALLEPVLYLSNVGGKGVRAGAIGGLSKKFTIDSKDLRSIQFCVERFHEASLCLDDIEDDSDLRRNAPCSHLVYGIPLTINGAYMGVFRLLNDVPQLFCDKHDKTRTLIVEALVDGHRGQGMDILWRDTQHVPSEREYIAMIRGKTSAAFVVSAALFFMHTTDRRILMLRASERVVQSVFVILTMILSVLQFIFFYILYLSQYSWKECINSSSNWIQKSGSLNEQKDAAFFLPYSAITKSQQSEMERGICHLFDKIGVFFQIRDDYINLTSPRYWEAKGFCEDLNEKKFSYPIVRMISRKQGRWKDLLVFLRCPERPVPMEERQKVLEWIQDTDALSHTRDVLLHLREDIAAGLSTLGLHDTEALMSKLFIDDPK